MEDISLVELRLASIELGLRVSVTGLHAAAFVTVGRAKNRLATEQSQRDVLSQQPDWFDGQLDLDPELLVGIDETWPATGSNHMLHKCSRPKCGLATSTSALWRERTEAAGATLRFLSPDSLDINSIEKAFSRLNAMLKKIGKPRFACCKSKQMLPPA